MHLTLTIKDNKTEINITNFYSPPSTLSLEILNKIHLYPNHIIIGDFNAHQSIWSQGWQNGQEETLLDWTNDNDLIILTLPLPTEGQYSPDSHTHPTHRSQIHYTNDRRQLHFIKLK